MLTLILAESSLERIPREIASHPSVVAQARRKKKKPNSLILDQSYHYSAMKALMGKGQSKVLAKRGRPDIVFHVLLQVLGSPLNREGLLRTYVHTAEDKVINIDPNLRLPRNYDRFIGVMEQLYDRGSVPPSEHPLIRIRECTLPNLLKETKSSMVVAFSTTGKPMTVKGACSLIAARDAPLVLIGGFAHSHFKRSTSQLADHIFSIDRESLDAWTVATRIIYGYEEAIHLPERRLRIESRSL